MPVTDIIIQPRGRAPEGARPPVIDMILNDPAALECLRRGSPAGEQRPRGRPPVARERLWPIEIERRWRGASFRGCRGTSGAAAGLPASRATMQRFANQVDGDPELSRLARAAEAHGRYARSAGATTTDIRELDIQRAALDCRELLAALDPPGRRSPARTHSAESLLRAFMVAEYRGIGSLSDLKRDLDGNPADAAWCGFEGRVPSRSTLSRFRTRLALLWELMLSARRRMLRELMRWEPSFGEELAIDCTFVAAWSNGRRKPHSDPDARFGHSTKNRGRMKTDVDLGYKMHMAVCARTGVPLSVITAPADIQEVKMLRPQLELTRAMVPALRLRSVSADKGYDSRANTEAVIAAGADPVIDIRGLPGGKPVTGVGGILMDREGTPFCPDCAEPMVFAGHAGSGPREQQCQVWVCPAECGAAPVRVRWADDPRRTPYWPRAAARSRERKAAHQAVERSNSQLKTIGSFITGHRARGIDRLSLLGEFATLMMQARALAAYRDGRPDDVRRKKTPVN